MGRDIVLGVTCTATGALAHVVVEKDFAAEGAPTNFAKERSVSSLL